MILPSIRIYMMLRKFQFLSFLLLLVCLAFSKPASAQTIAPCDAICGKWMATTKNLTILVYKEGEAFKAKITWFNDTDDLTRPMATRTDRENPDPKLRNRRILGMSVLEKMVFVAKSNSWENGVIYDALHGRYWDSAAYITPQGVMKVTGYWHFKFIGKTISFTRL